MKFTIENENFELRLGFGVFFILGKHWKLASYNDVLKRIIESFGAYANMDANDLQNQEFDLSLETIEVLADIVIAAITANKANGKTFDDFDIVEVVDAIMANMNVLPQLVKGLIDSMPGVKKQETPGKELAAKKKPH